VCLPSMNSRAHNCNSRRRDAIDHNRQRTCSDFVLQSRLPVTQGHTRGLKSQPIQPQSRRLRRLHCFLKQYRFLEVIAPALGRPHGRVDAVGVAVGFEVVVIIVVGSFWFSSALEGGSEVRDVEEVLVLGGGEEDVPFHGGFGTAWGLVLLLEVGFDLLMDIR